MEAGNIIGTAWALPLGINEGRLQTLRGPAVIEQAIWTILRTSPGELVTQPEFGSGLADLVFEPKDATLAGRVASAVSGALARWEPRIDVDDVRVVDPAGSPRELVVEIDYTVRDTNSRFNMVYPFYLEHER